MVHSVNKKFRQKAWITACSDLHMSRRLCLILVAHDSRISNATIRLLEKKYTALEAKNI